MDNFRDYIYYLLWSPLKKVEKEKNAWYKLAKVYGSLFDKAKSAILKAREETMVATCSPAMLQVHADERRLTRYTDETDENYRRRIATYPEVCRLGGTYQGVWLAVTSLGFKNHFIVPAKDLYNNPERWAEFYLILPFELDENWPIGITILKKVVRDTKETGAKDNYLIRVQSEICTEEVTSLSRVVFYFRFRWYDNITWNGMLLWNGIHHWNNDQSNHPMCTIVKMKQITEMGLAAGLTKIYHFRTWDGISCWDGTKKWDAEIIKEVL